MFNIKIKLITIIVYTPHMDSFEIELYILEILRYN